MGKGSVIWFTGLSSSGKSTLCGSTATLLAARMRQVQILDADKVREELCSDLGFSKDDHVSFRWKDYAQGSKQKVMTVSADEFLRRFLIHVLPKGLVRIRHFGLFANRKRSASLLRCRVLLNAAAPPPQPAPTAQIKCPLCSELMLVIERFNSFQLLSAPPSAAPIKPRLDSS